MRDSDFTEIMATWADGEARSTATLVEMLTAAVIVKIAPPSVDEVTSITIGQADLSEVLKDFHYETRYENGTMTLFLTRLATDGEG